ncbi:DUF4956 domain-containing protein [Cuneatibacter caecimuris]|uniref:Uncharacterized protein DUF4956 n=1 Tax=Cuneatibacter caecimuris TaxID=1796618 RepID=A0A4Q7P062_9FIRM|nr:DUF4956 domain-containing protein [Cuneatibacter caecimuris]RZS92658.1 uncharacterized protein DUF4956 [Cuneatibacter caecimuris]
MNFEDYFKKSVWETFTSSQGLTADFVVKAVVAMALAVILGILIYKIYGHYFGGVVFSRSFATTLVGMTVLSCMLTLAISSNIVISLGMVGALSIVRYRTAIKDPMDLLYLFWSISIGITLGAGIYVLAAVTMLVMLFVVHLFYNRRKKGVIYIMVVHYESGLAGDEILRSLGKMKYQLKSKTIRGDQTELTMELLCRNSNTLFMENIQAVEGVKDVTLIQYNGEYHG